MMWEEISRAVFDTSAKTGLRFEFLENLSAEAIGLVFGALLSVLVAALLDKLGNSRQFRALRRRVADQLAGIHGKLHEELSKPFDRSGDNSKSVVEAMTQVERIVDTYDFGLTPPQYSAVEAYRLKLQALSEVASKSKHRNSSVSECFSTASQALRPALERLHGGRLEEHWRDVLGRGLPNGSSKRESLTTSSMADRDEPDQAALQPSLPEGVTNGRQRRPVR